MAGKKKAEAPAEILDNDPLGIGQDTVAAGDTIDADREDRISAGEIAATETEFDRRINRLVNIVEEAEFESGTLVGDIRDAMLDLFKSRPKPWSAMVEDERRQCVRLLEDAAGKFVRKTVIVLAEEDDIAVHATLTGYSVDGDAFKLKAKAKGDEDTAIQLFRLDGHEVVIISADAKRFQSQRKAPDIPPDQMSIGFADPEPSKPADPPADDSDLADEEEGSVSATITLTETEAAEWRAAVDSDHEGDAGPIAEDAWFLKIAETYKLNPDTIELPGEPPAEGAFDIVGRTLGEPETEDVEEDPEADVEE